MGSAAALVHGRPSDRITVMGVTGTNGKTSVTTMIEAIEAASGRVCGVIGTLGVRVGDQSIPSERTTPEATDFQRLLATMADRGATSAAVEVSSHALALGRVDGTHFAVAAFTNLSQDHLDFHGDLNAYFEAKATLFDPDRSSRAVVFTDDEWGARLVERTTIQAMSVSIGGAADLTGTILAADLGGSDISVRFGGFGRDVRVRAAGRFSVANALVAAACCLSVGHSFDEVVAGMESIASVPGRFELVSGDDPVAIVVDYSHTPAGISAAIETARPLTGGKIVAVVGAGGDRDRSKRPLMGAAASAADVVVVTTDNPRSEPPPAIMADVMRGVTAPHEGIETRRTAIRRAIELAVPGDTILLMGKGHEAYQEIAGVKHPFHDATVAREELEAARGSET
jgi:UDP-N-acetylmuramoyl-L-alanyl-D-glutamate--2,6-diaminopimelate ligase